MPRRDSFAGVKRPLAVSLLALLFLFGAFLFILGPVLFLLSGVFGLGLGYSFRLDLLWLQAPFDAALLALLLRHPTMGLAAWLSVPIALSALCGVAGVGLWRLRSWARKAALVIATLAALNAIAKLFFLFFWQGGPTLWQYLALALTALVWIAFVWYLSQPSVKQAFAKN